MAGPQLGSYYSGYNRSIVLANSLILKLVGITRQNLRQNKSTSMGNNVEI